MPSPATHVLKVTVVPEGLEDWGALAEATGPEMRTSGTELWSSDAGQSSWDIHTPLTKAYLIY